MLEEGSGLSTEQTIDTGLPLIGSAIKMEWFKEPRRVKGGGVERRIKRLGVSSTFLNLPLSCLQVFCALHKSFAS